MNMKNKETIESLINDAALLIKELMEGWDVIMEAARKQFPNVSEEKLYEIAKGAMNHSLGLK